MLEGGSTRCDPPCHASLDMRSLLVPSYRRYHISMTSMSHKGVNRIVRGADERALER